MIRKEFRFVFSGKLFPVLIRNDIRRLVFCVDEDARNENVSMYYYCCGLEMKMRRRTRCFDNVRQRFSTFNWSFNEIRIMVYDASRSFADRFRKKKKKQRKKKKKEKRANTSRRADAIHDGTQTRVGRSNLPNVYFPFDRDISKNNQRRER